MSASIATRWWRIVALGPAMSPITVVLAAAAAIFPWNPVAISSPQFESHPAFDPWTGDLYFVRSSPQFRGWRLLTSQCGPRGWGIPRPPSFAGDGLEADPWFTSDGRSLYFISTRSTDGVKRTDLDIWRVDRDVGGHWGEPRRLPEPVNSTGNEWFPRVAPDGWLYFGSDRTGGFGKTDIWRARSGADGQWIIENAGPALNSEGDDYEAEFSPDGSRVIVMSSGGLHESLWTSAGWTPRVRLPAHVNVNGTEIGALFSPSGRSLMFARDTRGPRSGEFFVWQVGPPEDWPPTCSNVGPRPPPARRHVGTR